MIDLKKIAELKGLIAKRLLNSLLFYFGWFVCIDQAGGNTPYVGPIVIAFLLFVHLYFSSVRLQEVLLIGAVALVGTIVDSTYIWLGWVEYRGGYLHFPYIIPLWMTSLWAYYATTINSSLAWARRSLLLMIVLGGLGGFFSYAVAFRLDAADAIGIPLSLLLIIIGCVWAAVFPLTFYLNDKIGQWLQRARQ